MNLKRLRLHFSVEVSLLYLYQGKIDHRRYLKWYHHDAQGIFGRSMVKIYPFFSFVSTFCACLTKPRRRSIEKVVVCIFGAFQTLSKDCLPKTIEVEKYGNCIYRKLQTRLRILYQQLLKLKRSRLHFSVEASLLDSHVSERLTTVVTWSDVIMKLKEFLEEA